MGPTHFIPFILAIELARSAVAPDVAPLNAIPSVPIPASLQDALSKSSFGDDNFLENKNGILNMLEAKLKKIGDKKKKKNTERASSNNGLNFGLGNIGPENGTPCQAMQNLELKLKSNGLSGLGELGILLKHGNFGKGFLKVEATGVSNVGKAVVDMEVDDGNVHIPGLSHLFSGKGLCDPQQSEVGAKNVPSILAAVPTQSDNLRRNDNSTGNSTNTAVSDVAAANSTISPSLPSGDTTISVNAVSNSAAPVNNSAVPVNPASVPGISHAVPVSVPSAAPVRAAES